MRHCSIVLRRALLLGLTAVLTGEVGVAGQQLPAPGAPLAITLTAAPARTLAGLQVRLSGKTGYTGPKGKATVRVKAPGSAAPVVLAGAVKSDGSYSVTYAKTGAPGTYQVQAIAPDGKGQASATFSIVAPGVVPADVGRSADSLQSAITQALQAVKQAVQALPASPERAEAEQRLGVAQQRTATVPAQLAVLQQQLQKVFAARAKVEEDNPQWDAYVAGLEEWRAGAAQRSAGLRARIKSASAETQKCGRLDAYNEMLTMTSEALSFISSPFDQGQSFWVDKIPPAFIARQEKSPQYSPEHRFVAIQTMKLGAAALQGPKGLVLAVPGLVTDVAAFLVQQEFSKYCVKFEGPLTATFLGESFTTKGERFLDYTIQLDGKLVLMYDKGANTAKPVGVLGYLEGNGSFDVRDNPEPIVRLTPGTVLYHDVISPPGGRYWDELGQASRSLLPHSFRIPVKGTLAGDSILLALQPAIHDFGALIEGRTIYVVMPLGGLVPEVLQTRFPLQKAHPLLERTIRRHPVLRISYAGGTRAQGTFTRDTTNAGKTARVRTKVTVNACNPGCLPLPLAPKSKK